MFLICCFTLVLVENTFYGKKQNSQIAFPVSQFNCYSILIVFILTIWISILKSCLSKTVFQLYIFFKDFWSS